jgi:Xaa-Pro dipeptidase
MKRLPDGLILVSGGTEVLRNNDTPFPFRQDSNFLYLAGVEEPDFHLLLDPKRGTSTLLMPRIDDEHKIWLGTIPGPRDLKREFGFEKVEYLDGLPKLIKEARKKYRKFYANPAAARKFHGLLPWRKRDNETLIDALWELRAVKSPSEIEIIQKAVAVTAKGHRLAMESVRPGMREYEAQAFFDSHCLRGGLRHLAFPTIAAAGKNSAVLHYVRNDAELKDGDLLLLDAGGEIGGYPGDITRTFPIGKAYTQRQRDVYSIVLEAQKACIERAVPGASSLDLHHHAMRVFAEGLKSLGLLAGDTEGLVESGAVRLFFPHGLGHLMGLDVHDGNGGRRRLIPNPAKIPIRLVAKLEPGFVFTVEPGIYFIEALLRDPRRRAAHKGSVLFSKVEEFMDFGGVRIEDDILIREGAPAAVLTDLRTAPKEIPEIEEIRRAALG